MVPPLPLVPPPLLPFPLLPLPPRKPKPNEGALAIAPPFADTAADTGAEADADCAEEGWEETGDSSILEEATDEECRVAVDGLDRVRLGGGGATGADKDDENG